MALFNCPKCAWRVRFTDKDLGKKGKCLQCAHEFVFPSTLPKDGSLQAEKPVPALLPAQGRKKSGSAPALLKWVALAAVVLVPAGVIVAAFALGGSSPKPIVVGKVTYNSQPLSGGTII